MAPKGRRPGDVTTYRGRVGDRDCVSRVGRQGESRPRVVEDHNAVEECKPTWFSRVTMTNDGRGAPPVRTRLVS